MEAVPVELLSSRVAPMWTWRPTLELLLRGDWRRRLHRTGLVVGALIAISAPGVVIDRRIINVPPAVAGWLYLLVVLLATLYWGRSTGLITACLAGMLDYVLFISPRYTLRLEQWTDLLWLLVAVLGMVIAVEVVERVNRARRSALQRLAVELERERMQEQREAFLAAIVHDLRTPLTVIHGHAQLLERKATVLDAPQTEWLEAGLAGIDAATASMTALVDDMLDLTRLHVGKQLDLKLQAVDLIALVAQTVAIVQRTTGHAIGLHAAMPALVGQWDRRRLSRIVDNLLTNAVKYSPDGGSIDTSVTQEQDGDGWAVLSVHDHGMGIPANDLPHVFEWFHRGENVAGHIPGTGLGLAGTKQIVEQHGGTIAIVSEEGQGTTVTIRLPIIHVA